MIVFDLRCGEAHVFEAWFASTADYDSQHARGLIACPLCNDTAITKAAMAPAVPAKANRAPMSALLQAQRELESRATYVGTDFAAQARARHTAALDGAAERGNTNTPPSGIYGEASLADAIMLVEDGIPVLPLPFRPRARFDA